MKKIRGCLIFTVFLLLGTYLYAQTIHHPEAEGGRVPELTSVISGEGTEENKAEEEKSFLEKIEWAFGVNGTLQGSSSSKNSGFDDGTDGTFSADLELVAPIMENGSFYMIVEVGNGAGIDERIPTFSGFNDDADDNLDIHVTEIWYEHQWFSGRLRGRVGMVDLTTDFDCNEYANDENSQFLSTGFVNNLTLAVPENSFGGMLWFSLTERLEIGAGYCETNTEWEDLFNNGFGIFEIHYKSCFCGRHGNIRLYGWCNASKENVSWNDDLHEDNYGWGISFDQELTDTLGVFFRYGTQNKEVSPVASSLSLGIQWKQCWLCRHNDAVGIAYGCACLSRDYENIMQNEMPNMDDEHHLEVYYLCQVNDYVTITPDL
ncbi:MAG: carbohydrate porin [Planctomycetia bacterium]|nr:carbohydrate porin [Planctomycetia bacterium]